MVDFNRPAWTASDNRNRPESRRIVARRVRNGNEYSARRSGAVRLSKAPAQQRLKHWRRIFAGLTFIAGGILVTTASTGTVEPTPRQAVATKNVISPTFFFDDATDALSETMHAATLATEHPEPVATIDKSLPPALESLIPEGMQRPAAMKTTTLSPLVDHPSLAALREKAVAPADSVNTQLIVSPGDTLSGILNKHGVNVEQMRKLLTDEVVKKYLSTLKVGQKFDMTMLANGQFHSLSARIGKEKRITIRRSAGDFAIAAIDVPVEKERVVTSGTIEQSLYLAAEQAHLKQSTIMDLADIFQWELDFARDIQPGDEFSVVYDRLYREGKYIGDGDILAAEFVRGNRTYSAIRFTTDDGTTGYYSPDGQSKRRTFLRHPVDVVRITSRFDPNRLHPVLHQIRAHRGVDYGAPHGSPIRATADGKISFSGTKSTYGNTVVIQHGDKISTLYAHMSRISDKSTVGKRIQQGDVIGYVGKTGRVTGTHLHYEFRINGEHVDPLKVELPEAAPIAAEYRDALKTVSEEMMAQMRSVIPATTEQMAQIIE
jgi:murein DD-endopeptidase MepM/ murein hydrolase activator NlpD